LMANHESLFIVGIPEVVHVGAHFLEAAKSLGLEASIRDMREAYAGPAVLRRLNWWLRGRWPSRLNALSSDVLKDCARARPRWLLATGTAPLNRTALDGLEKLGVWRCIYLTDDPWNNAHRAPWFLKVLPLYDRVFSTRKANLDDLRRLGCRNVSFLPFAYSPAIHHPENELETQPGARSGADLLFAGGADRDRVPYLAACIQAGFRVQLHGGYWERFAATRGHTGGLVGPDALRAAICRAKVSLCLVRRANRDGHVMRTFELPAMGACMLTEDTDEHRTLFGSDRESVVYFRTPGEAVNRLRWLLANDDERLRLAASAHRLVVQGKNTYRDRLETILATRG
jgi:spore maturation protein CgeB